MSVTYQSVQQMIRDGAEAEAVETVLSADSTPLTDKQIADLRAELRDRDPDGDALSKPRKLEITLAANPDADDCLAEAATRHVAEYPDLAGWDLEPRWTDDTRERVTLTVPRWHYDDLQQNAD